MLSATEFSHAPLGPDPGLRELVEACVARYPSDGTAALEDLCASYPKHAAQLRRRVAILQRSGLLEVGQPSQQYPDQLGDFRLGELIGEGGMGAVFRATQVSLGRAVALKVIRAEQAYSPRARERFRREVEAIAALQSPGIVPIYTVGEHDGVAFYAMELVDGVNLAELLLELRRAAPERMSGADLRAALLRVLPSGGNTGSSESDADALFAGSYVQACCRIVLRVARTLAHAHERGVLHRDVKPSNIMIDRGGRVLLLDFGLARALEPGSEGLTASGAQVGSPAYMAPEQARGERTVDGRVDVYGLGITLYELLTHRTAFRGDSQADLRDQILAGVVVSPAQFNPAVPRDAETVCLKAMASERGRRYPGPGAFADDLQRFLDLRPIEARRAGLGYRLRRWVQRRPAAATALASALLLTVGGPLAFAWQQSSARRDLQTALDRSHELQRELSTALDQSQRYQRSYQRALETALSGMGRTALALAENRQLASGRLDSLRRELLQGALGFYADLDRVDDPSPAVRRELLRARLVQSDLLRALGELDPASTLLDRALADLEADFANADADSRPALAESLARALHQRARTRADRRQFAPARADWQRSIEVAEQWLQVASNSAAVRRHIARSELNLAQLDARTGDYAAAEAGCRKVIAAVAETAGEEALLFDARTALGNVLMHASDYRAAVEQLELALPECEKRAGPGTEDTRGLRELYSARHNLGFAYRQLAELPLAKRHLTAAIEVGRRILAAYPERVDGARYTAQSSMVLASVNLIGGEGEAAEAVCREAITTLASFAERPGAGPEERGLLAELRGTFGQILMNSGRYEEAVAALGPAVEVMQALAERPDAGPQALDHYGATCGLLASALKAQGDLAGARAMLDRGLDALFAVRARDQRSQLHVGNLTRCLGIAFSHACDAKDLDRQRELVRRALGDAAVLAAVEKSMADFPELATQFAAARAALEK